MKMDKYGAALKLLLDADEGDVVSAIIQCMDADIGGFHPVTIVEWAKGLDSTAQKAVDFPEEFDPAEPRK